VLLRDGARVACEALVVASRLTVRSDVLTSLGVQPTDLTRGDLVIGNRNDADPTGATAVPGVWVAGNVADPLAQVAAAGAAGLSAGAAINADLTAQDTARAVSAAEPPAAYVGDPAVQAEWDSRYADREQLWSGQPNGALVAEVAGLAPGRVLDVGCGEGADAVWLAGRGWDVTALEVSGVALRRAAGHARDAGVAVRWVHAGLVEAGLPPRSYDLVCALYPALLATPDAAAERALLDAVAPGGILLLVHHAGMETGAHDSGFDPADYVWPAMVAARLDGDWEIEVDEQRPRVTPGGGAGAHHRDDLVLRARRLR
jgi:SAM-dependent methyltransferase